MGELKDWIRPAIELATLLLALYQMNKSNARQREKQHGENLQRLDKVEDRLTTIETDVTWLKRLLGNHR